LEELILRIKGEKGGDIYCDGGGQIVKLLMENNLIDDYIISIIPIILGSGKRLFFGDSLRTYLKFKSVKSYEKGLIKIHYERKQ